MCLIKMTSVRLNLRQLLGKSPRFMCRGVIGFILVILRVSFLSHFRRSGFRCQWWELTVQECQINLASKIRPDWHKMGHIWDFLRSVFWSFLLDVKKSQICPILCQSVRIRDELCHPWVQLPLGNDQGCQIWHLKRVRLVPNGTNLGLFSDQIQYILAQWPTFGPNLTCLLLPSDFSRAYKTVGYNI